MSSSARMCDGALVRLAAFSILLSWIFPAGESLQAQVLANRSPAEGQSANSEPSNSSSQASQPASLEAAWDDLGSNEPLKAFRSAVYLSAGGQKAADFLSSQLASTKTDTRVPKLIADLDSDSVQTRDEAQEELASMGPAVEAHLRKALQTSQSFEVRSRIEELLKKTAGSTASPDSLRAARAIHALELMNSSASRALLEQIAASDEINAPVAKEALKRLVNLSSSAPATQKSSGLGSNDKTLLVAQWTAVAKEEIVEAILFQAKSVHLDSRWTTAVMCNRETLRAVFPSPNKDASTPEMLAVSPNLDWMRIGRNQNPISCGYIGGLYKKMETVARCDVFWDAEHKDTREIGGARLNVKFKNMSCAITWMKDSPQDTKKFRDSFKLETLCPAGQVVVLVTDLGSHNKDHPYLLAILEVIEVPTRLAVYFESVSNRQWQLLGYEKIMDLARQGLAWNLKALSQKRVADSKSVLTLPGGGQARITGIWNPAVHPFYTWDRDGIPIPCDPRKMEDISDELSVGVEIRPHDKANWERRGSFSPDKSTGKLEFCMSDGQWQNTGNTLALNQPVSADGITCMLTSVQADAQRRRVQVKMTIKPFPDFELAVGAIDKNGNLILPLDLSENKTIYDRVGYQITSSAGQQVRDDMLAVDEADIDHYVLLSRLRSWAIFESIPSKPNKEALASQTQAATAEE